MIQQSVKRSARPACKCDSIGYDLAVDYAKPPEVQLPTEWASWVAERLQTYRGDA